MSEEFKKYDADTKTVAHNMRLTKDAEVLSEGNGERPPMIRLSFVDTSRDKEDEDKWVDVIPRDGDAVQASFMKKGDVLGYEGHETMRKWGDNKDKISFRIKGAQLHIPISLFLQLKERGFVPGQKNTGASKGKPTATPAKKPARPVVNLDD